MSFLLHLLIKSTLLLIGILLLLPLLQQQKATLRHTLISWLLLALLALPVLILMVPVIQYTQPTVIENNLPVIEKKWVNIKKQQQVPSNPTSTKTPPTRAILIEKNQSKVALPISNQEKGNSSYLANFFILQICYFIWLLGATICLLKYLIGAWLIRRITKKSESFVGISNLNALSAIPIKCSKQITTPMTYGLFRSIILLPVAAKQWEEELLQIVLLHECIHIERRDYAWHLIGLLTVSIYWWHPLIWLLKQQQVLEREKACDEAVLYRGTSKKKYAQSLLFIAKSLTNKRSLYLNNTLPMAKKSQLKKRVMAILKFQTNHTSIDRIIRYLSLFIGIISVPVLAGLSPIRALLSLPSIETTLPKVIPAKKRTIKTATFQPITAISEEKIEQPQNPILATRKEATLTQLTNPIAVLPIVDKKLDFSTKLIKNNPSSPALPTGLYGEWEEGKSTYKVWTYGTYTTIKSVPYIKAETNEALILVEEKRKTMFGEKTFKLLITKAPYNGGLVNTYSNGTPYAWSGGYKKGEPVLLWWVDDKWMGWSLRDRDEWISTRLNNIARNIELADYQDASFEMADSTSTSWWTVIQQQQQIQKDRFIADTSMTSPGGFMTWVTPTNKAASANMLRLKDIPYKALAVSKTKSSKKKLGRTIVSKTLCGCGGCSPITATQFGTLIKTNAPTSALNSFHFHLAKNTFESIQFELELYKVKNNEVLYRLTKNPVSFEVQQKEGWIETDLSAYDIPIQGDVLVLLKPIKVVGEPSSNSLFFSLSASHWLYKPFHKKNKQRLEDFWDGSFAMYFTTK